MRMQPCVSYSASGWFEINVELSHCQKSFNLVENSEQWLSSSHFSGKPSATRRQWLGLPQQRLFAMPGCLGACERHSGRVGNLKPEISTSTILRDLEAFSDQSDSVTIHSWYGMEHVVQISYYLTAWDLRCWWDYSESTYPIRVTSRIPRWWIIFRSNPCLLTQVTAMLPCAFIM